MKPRALAGIVVAVTCWLGWSAPFAFADDDDEGVGEPDPGPTDPPDDEAEQPEPSDDTPDQPDDGDDGALATGDTAGAGADDGPSDAEAADGAGAADEEDEDEPLYVEYDTDGDGVVDADEAAFEKDYEGAFDDIPDDVSDDALDARGDEAELVASMSVEDFRNLVVLARNKVLDRLEAKIARKQKKRMTTFTMIVCGFSLAGIFLLAMPLVLRKKYPGQDKVLFKYSALAALTFFVTVNLFGGVLMGLREAQGALSSYTNPQVAIAAGFFDTLYTNADDYVLMGKELFGPTLEQLAGNSDEQPTVTLLENGTKIIEDAKVFTSMAGLFKKVDFLFAILPIVLILVTLVLFVLAIRPTLVEIVKLPALAASGRAGAGQQVVKGSTRRVIGELQATLCTLVILAALTVISSVVLGQIVGPALDGLLAYFSLAVMYLQFVDGASSGLVFVTLFGVIFFLVLNLATLILSMSFFLGKSQKIFQQRFNEKVPIANHKRFWKWGIPAVLGIQLFPWLFIVMAEKGLSALNDSLLEGVSDASDVNWSALLVAGPLLLVFAYIAAFWAARGIKAIRFLHSYKVKTPDPAP